ncbi:hypothetical protein AAFF_G00277880 [Aldrovandia affinis]|uniref:Ig-like domain-containing protein n=1 Tax=Aldrovandia affinis TaxID=143900 RepID=A0AAD7RA62_9TELE|nr:hypothetical protein AAFF_G00277880 [Aldrovandia affinis]
MERGRLRIFALLAGLAGSGVLQAGGMTVNTPAELEAVNGTDVKLKCTFQSTAPISLNAVSVSWNFRPLLGRSEESVFFYQEQPYPPSYGRFKGHVFWAGDIARGDGSIMVRDVRFTFNGTFSCQVKNPPDVHGTAGELLFKVVQTASFSEMAILATAIGSAIGLVLLILFIFIIVKFCRRRSLDSRDLEMPQWEGKDPTVCDPEETLPLNGREDDVENNSTDEAVSEEDEKKSLKTSRNTCLTGSRAPNNTTGELPRADSTTRSQAPDYFSLSYISAV